MLPCVSYSVDEVIPCVISRMVQGATELAGVQYTVSSAIPLDAAHENLFTELTQYIV